MASRIKRIRSWQEARDHIRIAREFSERYSVDEVNPAEFLTPPPDQADWDALLQQIK